MRHHFSNVHISIKSADFYSGHILFISDTSVHLLQSISSDIMQMFPAVSVEKPPPPEETTNTLHAPWRSSTPRCECKCHAGHEPRTGIAVVGRKCHTLSL